jgi:hypothetical protein
VLELEGQGLAGEEGPEGRTLLGRYHSTKRNQKDDFIFCDLLNKLVSIFSLALFPAYLNQESVEMLFFE